MSHSNYAREKQLNRQIASEKKRLTKRKDSSSSEYWNLAAEIAAMEETAANVQLYFGNFSDSQLSEDGEAKELFTKMKAAEKEKELFEDQAIRLNPQGIDLGTKRKGFVELFARGHLGYKNEIRQLEAQIRQLQSQVDRLKCQIGQGEYDILGNQVEQEFREACIAKYKPVRGEEPLLSSIWCPVENRWQRESGVEAVHIFAYWHGQNVMDAIFGQMKEPELFSPRNGLLVSGWAARFISSGYLAIVPDVPNEPTKDDIQAWNNSEPKEYKVRLLDPNWQWASYLIDGITSTERWNDLDGKRLQFKNNFRPRTSYLYFLYVTQMMQLAWTSKKQGQTNSKAELKFWGVPGSYLPKTMLLGLVEEMGQEYDHLLEGAVQDTEGVKKTREAKETEMAIGLLTVLRQLKKPQDEESGDEDEVAHKWEVSWAS